MRIGLAPLDNRVKYAVDHFIYRVIRDLKDRRDEWSEYTEGALLTYYEYVFKAADFKVYILLTVESSDDFNIQDFDIEGITRKYVEPLIVRHNLILNPTDFAVGIRLIINTFNNDLDFKVIARNLRATLLHEFTHIFDKRLLPTFSGSRNKAFKSKVVYFNSPTEVTAYLRSVYTDIDKRLIRRRNITAIELLESSYIWNHINVYLLPKAKQRFYKMAIRLLEQTHSGLSVTNNSKDY